MTVSARYHIAGRGGPRPRPVEERMADKISTDPSGCWIWTGALHNGYGQICVNGEMEVAHRVSYELARGSIPNGYQVDHLCRVRACVNPDHLEAVTQQENNRRSESITALNLRKTACKRGHPFTPENTIIRKRARECRTCNIARRAGE